MTDDAAEKAAEAKIAADLQQLDRAIAKLTAPWTSTVTQRPAGGGRREAHVQHRALIPTLVEAVTVAYGSSRSGGTSTGAVVNEVAFQKVRDLTRDITRSWQHLIPSSSVFVPSWKVTLDRLLLIWWQTFQHHYEAGTVSPQHLAAESRKYTMWVAVIDLMFDPARTSSFTGECPRCKKGWVTLNEGAPDEEVVDAIIINFASAAATCRACGEVWTGRAEMQKLAAGYVKRGPIPSTPHDTPVNAHA